MNERILPMGQYQECSDAAISALAVGTPGDMRRFRDGHASRCSARYVADPPERDRSKDFMNAKRNSRSFLQRSALFGILLLLVTQGVFDTVVAFGSRPLPAGEYRFQTEALRLRQIHLRLPSGELLDYTGKGDVDEGTWQVRFTASSEDPKLWQVQLEQISDAVRREVVYWVHVPTPEDLGPMEPVFASETAYDAQYGHVLMRAQAMDWSLRYRDTVYTVAIDRATAWVLNHLDAVYDADVLTACADYYFHSPGDEHDTTGYSRSVACTNRMIVLDPQAIDLYTTNAWLLWSNWVTWKQDPQQVTDGTAKLKQAIRLIRQGRAANPGSAAYHYDAANTMTPLALHHLPDLMDWVIQYYHHAEALAKDKALRTQICKVLGHRYRIQGKTTEAMRWYRITLELDPENEVAQRYLKQLESQAEEGSDHAFY